MNIPPSGKIDVRSCLWTKFFVICEMCVEHYVETSATIADVLRMPLCSLSMLRNKWELLAAIDLAYSNINLVKSRLQLFGRVTSKHPAVYNQCYPKAASLRPLSRWSIV